MIPKSSIEQWFCKSKDSSKMSMLFSIVSIKSIMTLNPMSLAISILIVSLLVTTVIFKATCSSWIAFVTILTFSSGMMTLFMYTTSMSANEKTKKNKSMKMMIMVMIMFSIPTEKLMSKESMKMFSSNMFLMIMSVILITTMVTITMHGHHPNQTISSSF